MEKNSNNLEWIEETPLDKSTNEINNNEWANKIDNNSWINEINNDKWTNEKTNEIKKFDADKI